MPVANNIGLPMSRAERWSNQQHIAICFGSGKELFQHQIAF